MHLNSQEYYKWRPHSKSTDFLSIWHIKRISFAGNTKNPKWNKQSWEGLWSLIKKHPADEYKITSVSKPKEPS